MDLSGYSLQYASNTGTTYTVCNLSTAAVGGDTVIEAGTYYLIATGSASATIGTPLTNVNAVCTNISMAATAGKVALVNNTVALNGAPGGVITCPTTGATVVDYVGYGTTVSCFEGTGPTPVPSATISVQRILNGTDTNQNATDFQALVPTPGTVNLAPTAASVSIEGRVMTVKGRGISRAQITLTDAEGNTRLAMSNSFGYYRFFDIAAGETYILSIRSKSHQFAEPTRVINVTEDLTGADFVAYW